MVNMVQLAIFDYTAYISLGAFVRMSMLWHKYINDRFTSRLLH